jgi:ABC-2 type transport system permease protein
MNLRHSWIIARKDIKVFIRKRTVLYTIVLLPLMLSIVFPLVIEFAKGGGITGPYLQTLLHSFEWFFVIIPAIIPAPIASYSIVGEKLEKSLERLLATPTTDGEILLGKGLAAFIPAIIATYAGASIFMTLIDAVTYGRLGYLYYPNWDMGIILFLLAPLALLLSIELNIITSSRVTDVRAAGQAGSLMFLPFIAIYIASEIGLFTLDTNALLIIAGVIAVLDVVMFRISTSLFQREQILTMWK